MTTAKSPIAAGARLLSNGALTTLITGAGTGFTALGDCALTRWQGDPVEDADGYFIYLRDLDDGAICSVGRMPCKNADASYSFGSDARGFWLACSWRGLEARIDVSVDAVSDLERRSVSVRNSGGGERHVEVISYLEVVLNARAAEASHPAFSKLFVQTEAPHSGMLLARRRPRGADEKGLWLVHAASGGIDAGFETDRKRFIGRGASLAAPAALQGDGLSGSAGNVLDPALSLRRALTLPAGAADTVDFLLGAAPGRAEALAMVKLPRAACSAPFDAIAEQDSVLAMYGSPAAAPPSPSAPHSQKPQQAQLPQPAPRFFNGDGGFSADGTEYVVRLAWDGTQLSRPPLPWTNVIANEQVGVLVSETGAGYTWSRNSREHRLTPWFNDPVRDPHGEALYLRDEDSGAWWSPMPGPAPAQASYEAVHGFGYTTFRHSSHGLLQESTVFVPRHDPLKIVQIRLTNTTGATIRVSLTSFQQLVMGGTPADSGRFVRTEHEAGVLLATSRKGGPFADGVAFATLTGASSHSTDRASFIGTHGTLANPAAMDAAQLDGRSSLDPCAAFRTQLSIAPGEQIECEVLLGETTSRAASLALAQRYTLPGAAAQALAEVRAFWSATLGAVQIETPRPAIDLMVNGWLAYQNLSCRIWGRSAFYQSGGAIGYRDQLQDSSAMIYTRPHMTRDQIRLHAAHQFVEGDVLHWWHPAPLDKGLRTRFSDDLLWLPYVTAFYINTTGDRSVLDEVEPFLKAPLLPDGEDEVFLQPELSGESADVYEHCCRALDRSLTKGAHGLPLMGTGDWNDGMSRVGREGRGESVWMGFFLFRIISDFLPICERRGDSARIAAYGAYHAHLAQALNGAGWDGAWYRRAYYDNGAVMGSSESDECKIDALAQAWSVISGAAPPERAQQALDAMEAQLVSDEDQLIRLLTPPFVDTVQDPGYIKGYVAGVRENGGQYTHAACWAVRAVAEAGRGARAAQLLEMLSPVSHALTPEAVAAYQVEPYVIAADIYGAAPHVGRGGWTWYTGSAGWMFRVALESVLGFTLVNGDTIRMYPAVPSEWPRFTIRYRLPDGATSYAIEVINDAVGENAQVVEATLDGVNVPVQRGAALIPMAQDGAAHTVTVILRAH